MTLKLYFLGNLHRGLGVLSKIYEEYRNSVELIFMVDTTISGYPDLINRCKEMNLEFEISEDPLRYIANLPKYEYCAIILAGYSRIIPLDVINSCNPIFNLHGGKLPKYRGSSPLNWAMIEGDLNFTTTLTIVDEKIDDGEIVDEEKFFLEDFDNIEVAHHKSNEAFIRILRRFLDKLIHNQRIIIEPIEVDRKFERYYPLRSESDSLILWELQNYKSVLRLIKSSGRPYNGGITYLDGKKFKIYNADEYNPEFRGTPGKIYKIFDDNSFLVCCSDRCIKVTQYECYFEGRLIKFNLQHYRYSRFDTLNTIIRKMNNDQS